MRILVLHDYRGVKTAQELIRKGEYDAEDPRVYGIAAYLVDNGHARVIAAEMPAVAPVSIETADAPVETQEPPVLDDSGAFEEVPNTRAVSRRKGK